MSYEVTSEVKCHVNYFSPAKTKTYKTVHPSISFTSQQEAERHVKNLVETQKRCINVTNIEVCGVVFPYYSWTIKVISEVGENNTAYRVQNISIHEVH